MTNEMSKNNAAYDVVIPGLDGVINEVKYLAPEILDNGNIHKTSEVTFKPPGGKMVDARICYHPNGKKGFQYEVTVFPATKDRKVYYARLENARYATAEEAAEAYIDAAQRWSMADDETKKRYTDTVRGSLSDTDLTEFGIHTELTGEEEVTMLPPWEYNYMMWTVVVDREAAVRTPEGNLVSIVMRHDHYDDDLMDRNPVYKVQVCAVTTDGKPYYMEHPYSRAYGTLKEAEKAFFEAVGSWVCDDHTDDLKAIVDFCRLCSLNAKDVFSVLLASPKKAKKRHAQDWVGLVTSRHEKNYIPVKEGNMFKIILASNTCVKYAQIDVPDKEYATREEAWDAAKKLAIDAAENGKHDDKEDSFVYWGHVQIYFFSPEYTLKEYGLNGPAINIVFNEWGEEQTLVVVEAE